jgi:AbrB family looped-hinge helix DNA binding protein
MDSIKASSKGQMIIPKSVRDEFDIKSGTELDVEVVPGEGFMVKVRTTDHRAQVRRLAGSLAHRAKRMTPEQEEAAMLVAIGADDDRIKAYSRKR